MHRALQERARVLALRRLEDAVDPLRLAQFGEAVGRPREVAVRLRVRRGGAERELRGGGGLPQRGERIGIARLVRAVVVQLGDDLRRARAVGLGKEQGAQHAERVRHVARAVVAHALVPDFPV